VTVTMIVIVIVIVIDVVGGALCLQSHFDTVHRIENRRCHRTG
jgi:hypothetical protein